MQQLGRYEILAELGRGAMGAVFRARDPGIDRTVAIKTIAVPGSDTKSFDDYRKRFFREAQAAGRLLHPGIVTIFDVGEDQTTQTPFIVMEYVDGRTLDEFVAHAPGGMLPVAAALDLIQQIAEGLNYAHGAGIVHRDIKPANIIVTAEGRTKITDFGIAKVSRTEATIPGQIMGTPAYMSPEQINGKSTDGRSDLFSLGVIAYWLLTGAKPFDADTVTAICVQVVTKDPPPVSELAPPLGAGYDYVLSRALAKDPERRYQSGKDFAADVQDLRSGNPPRSLVATSQIAAVPQAERTILVPLAGGSPSLSSSASGTATRMQPSQAMRPAFTRTAGERRHKPRRGAYLFAAALFVLGLCGVLALRLNSSKPATLQIVGRYPFHTAEIYIWVDGDLRYHDELRGAAHSHSGPSHTSPGNDGSIALTLPVRAGRHLIRIQVNAEGRSYDHDTAIPGQFRPYSQKTLLVNFSSRNLDLNWE